MKYMDIVTILKKHNGKYARSKESDCETQYDRIHPSPCPLLITHTSEYRVVIISEAPGLVILLRHSHNGEGANRRQRRGAQGNANSLSVARAIFGSGTSVCEQHNLLTDSNRVAYVINKK
jgi:hypothetical protein